MIIVKFNAYDLKRIQSSYDEIKSLVSELDGKITPIRRLPQRKRRVTVLKSPHVFNKSKEQFEWVSYKAQCKISWNRMEPNNEKLFSLFILAVSALSFPGTQINLKSLFQTSIINYAVKL